MGIFSPNPWAENSVETNHTAIYLFKSGLLHHTAKPFVSCCKSKEILCSLPLAGIRDTAFELLFTVAENYKGGQAIVTSEIMRNQGYIWIILMWECFDIFEPL